MKLQTIAWKRGAVELIDQTKLPERLTYIRCTTVKQVWEAIRVLRVRGAPAIGAAAALGLVLGVYNKKYARLSALHKDVEKISKYLASSRPTAVNLAWALERTKQAGFNCQLNSIEAVKQVMLNEALAIMNEDKASCRAMADYAQPLIKNGDNILTYCNAGLLATVDYGTAVGCIYRAKEIGKNIKVYSCETRPLLQGARLT
ncbi:MAG: S-methyl-5-thioribose-1-phosphate isomerase, partial [Candidatus Heimdallarchaeota archaeon]|nr:S-methyl-5-thioribose-1-phosphate isomerase [Candidatus Heimdallarchaeota archaeon]